MRIDIAQFRPSDLIRADSAEAAAILEAQGDAAQRRARASRDRRAAARDQLVQAERVADKVREAAQLSVLSAAFQFGTSAAATATSGIAGCARIEQRDAQLSADAAANRSKALASGGQLDRSEALMHQAEDLQAAGSNFGVRANALDVQAGMLRAAGKADGFHMAAARVEVEKAETEIDGKRADQAAERAREEHDEAKRLTRSYTRGFEEIEKARHHARMAALHG